MALLPMGPPSTTTSQRSNYAGYYASEMQETMFDEPIATEAYQTTYDTPAETSCEPIEDFTEDVPELISYQSGSGHAVIDPAIEPETPGAEAAEHQPETAVAHQETLEQAQAAPEAVSEPVQESSPEPQFASASAPATMLTANDFAALEERVLRTVTLLRSERQARIAAEERMASMESQLHSFEAQIQQIEAQSPILERLVQEVESLRIEREQVRQRVERLLGQLDALEL